MLSSPYDLCKSNLNDALDTMSQEELSEFTRKSKKRWKRHPYAEDKILNQTYFTQVNEQHLKSGF